MHVEIQGIEALLLYRSASLWKKHLGPLLYVVVEVGPSNNKPMAVLTLWQKVLLVVRHFESQGAGSATSSAVRR